MRLVVIFVAGPVRHMSVRAGSRMGETTDKHGQRPYGSPGLGPGRRLARSADTTQRVPLMDLAVKQQASGEFDPARGVNTAAERD